MLLRRQPTTSSPGSRPSAPRCSILPRRRHARRHLRARSTELGDATGHEDEAADVVAEHAGRHRRARRRGARTRREPPTYYHELDDTLLHGDVDDVHRRDVRASPASRTSPTRPIPTASSAATRSSRAEFLVDADPDFIFLADTECCGQNAETVAARPGFADLTAVAERSASSSCPTTSRRRWGPRVVDLLAHDRRGHGAVPVPVGVTPAPRRAPTAVGPAPIVRRRAAAGRVAGGRRGGGRGRGARGPRRRSGPHPRRRGRRASCSWFDTDLDRRRSEAILWEIRLPAGRARAARRVDARPRRRELPGRRSATRWPTRTCSAPRPAPASGSRP